VTKRKWVITGVLLLVIAYGTVQVISFTGWGGSVLFPVSKAGRELMAPLFKGINSVIFGTQDFFGYFTDNRKLRQQNEELQQNVNQLEGKLNGLQEQELENKRLLDLLNYKEEKAANYNLVLAQIIGRDASNWYKSVVIDQGSNHGLKVNMPVITHQGLVGTIINISANTAEVLLILDGEGAVGARVFENRVTPGVIIGTGHSDVLKMVHLAHNSQIEKNQTVVTSGLGGLYPKGIRIGTIEEVKLEPNGLTKTALVRPFVDFSRLEEVFVILQVKALEEDQPTDAVKPDTSVPPTQSKGSETR